MTRDECKKLLMTMEAIYPNFNVEDKSTTTTAWLLILGDYEYKTMEMALKLFVQTSGSAFAPSASQLIEILRKPKELSEMDSTTAWIQVRKALRNSTYNAGEEFDKLPEFTQKVIGSPNQLRSWGQMESREVDSVVWSNFKRSYEAMQSRERQIASMPQNIQLLIQNAQQKMLTAE